MLPVSIAPFFRYNFVEACLKPASIKQFSLHQGEANWRSNRGLGGFLFFLVQ